MNKKYARIILLGVCFILFINLVRSWEQLTERRALIFMTRDTLEKEKEKQVELRRELAKVESNSYIEKQAREKLSLVREGEVIVMLPPITPVSESTPTPIDTSANWEKWLRIFVKE